MFASNILNVNIKEYENKIEIFFNFDTPYEGNIIQKIEKEKIKIVLKDAKIAKPWLKKVNTPFVYQIELQPLEKDSELIIYTIEKAAVLAAKSSDGFGLKLLIKKLIPITKSTNTKKEQKNESNLMLFIIGAIFIIAIFIAILLIFTSKKSTIKKKIINIKNPKESELDIKFEKNLDEHNKLALISFKGINYLVIIGSTNILLGKYPQDVINKEEDFEKIIEENQTQIKNIFSNNEEQEVLNELESYKEKASR